MIIGITLDTVYYIRTHSLTHMDVESGGMCMSQGQITLEMLVMIVMYM